MSESSPGSGGVDLVAGGRSIQHQLQTNPTHLTGEWSREENLDLFEILGIPILVATSSSAKEVWEKTDLDRS